MCVIGEDDDSEVSKSGRRPAMKWTGQLLVQLVQAVYHLHIGDPDQKKYGERLIGYADLLREDPWKSQPALAGGSWRPLYTKMLKVLKEYEAAITAEKKHTGGGQPNRPPWWADCEKELDTINSV